MCVPGVGEEAHAVAVDVARVVRRVGVLARQLLLKPQEGRRTADHPRVTPHVAVDELGVVPGVGEEHVVVQDVVRGAGVAAGVRHVAVEDALGVGAVARLTVRVVHEFGRTLHQVDVAHLVAHQELGVVEHVGEPQLIVPDVLWGAWVVWRPLETITWNIK